MFHKPSIECLYGSGCQRVRRDEGLQMPEPLAGLVEDSLAAPATLCPFIPSQGVSMCSLYQAHGTAGL